MLIGADANYFWNSKKRFSSWEVSSRLGKKQVALTLVVAMISSFVGGALSSQLFLAQPVLAAASSSPRVQRTVIAQEFRLVDSSGGRGASLQVENNGLITTFTLFGRNGRQKIKFVVDGYGNPSAHFWDKQARGNYIPTSVPSISFWDSKNQKRATLP